MSIGPVSGIGEGERSPKPECCDLSKNGRSTEVVDSLIFLSEARVDDKSDVSWVPGGPRPCSKALSG